jgi:hypothetical protein
MLHRHLFLALLAISLVPAGTVTQERVAMRVTVAGLDVPPQLQPRVVIESQPEESETRLEIRGAAALDYAATIALGDALDVLAVAHDGSMTRMFNGFVSRFSAGTTRAEPIVEISATGPNHFIPSAEAIPIGSALLAFAPRLSASFSLQEVIVRGLDVAGAPITGLASAPTIALGGVAARFGEVMEVSTDQIFASQADADAFALATLTRSLETRVSAEAVIVGNPNLGIGSFVELQGLNVEFDGVYYVAGVSHRIGHESYGGFSTTLRVRRNDLGMFHLPEIDDEVLVAFQHGDIDQPYRIESWWSCDSRPRPTAGDSDQCRYLRWPW